MTKKRFHLPLLIGLLWAAPLPAQTITPHRPAQTKTAVPHQYIVSFDAASGMFVSAQPAAGDVSGLGSLAGVTPTGTPSATTYLGGDFVWHAVPGGTVTGVTGDNGAATGLTLTIATGTTTPVLTLGGTLTPAHGGTGATGLTGFLYGNGAGAATAGTSAQVQTLIGTNVYQPYSATIPSGYLGTSGTTALAGNTPLLQLGTTGTTALAGNTPLLQLGTTSTTALAGNTVIPSASASVTEFRYSTGAGTTDTPATSAQAAALLSGGSGTLTLTGYTTGLAPLASPAFTGTPTVPTAAVGDNSTKAASTQYADRAVLNAASSYATASQGTAASSALQPSAIGTLIEPFNSAIVRKYDTEAAMTVDSRIAGLTPSTATQNLFSATNDTTNTYTRNTGGWFAGVDLTCISTYSSGGPGNWYSWRATLVNPIQAISAHHIGYVGGDTITVWYTDNNNVSYSRTVHTVQNITGDLDLLTFNAALPASITPAQVLPATLPPGFTFTGLPVLYTDQNRQAFVADIATIFSGTPAVDTLAVPAESNRAPWCKSGGPAITNDSSSPYGLILNGRFVILGTFYSQTGNSPDPGANAALIASYLANGYSLNVASLPVYPGIIGIAAGSATALSAGSNPTIFTTTTNGVTTVSIGVPAGPAGAAGPTGPAGGTSPATANFAGMVYSPSSGAAFTQATSAQIASALTPATAGGSVALVAAANSGANQSGGNFSLTGGADVATAGIAAGGVVTIAGGAATLSGGTQGFGGAVNVDGGAGSATVNDGQINIGTNHAGSINVGSTGGASINLRGLTFVPTATAGTNTTQAATTAFVGTAVSAIAPALQTNASATSATAWAAPNSAYQQTIALTANTTDTLPPAASYKAGTQIVFIDGFTTGAFGIAWGPQGSDTQDIGAGTTSTAFTPFTGQGSCIWVSNGSNKWSVVWIPAARVTGAASLTTLATSGSYTAGNATVYKGNAIGGVNSGTGFETALGYNAAGNKQLWLGDPDYAGNASGAFLRVNIQSGVVTLDAVNGSNTALKPLTSSAPWTFTGGWAVGSGTTGVNVTRLRHGVATLASGTYTVPDTNVTANTRILLTPQDNNTTGYLRVSARTAGTSFVLTSSNPSDSGVVAYEEIEP